MGGTQSYLSSEAALTALVVAGAIGIGYSQMGATSGATPNTPAVIATEGQATASKKGKKKKQSKAGLSAAGDISEALSASKSESKVPSPPLQRVAASQEVIPGQFDPTPTQTPVQDQSEPSAKPKSKKSKKKAKGKAQADSTADSKNAQPISSSIDYLSETSAQATPPKTAKRQTSTQQSKKQSPPASSSSQLTRPSQQSTASIETDGSWTRVGPPRRGPKATDADSSQLSAEADPTTSDAGITPSVTGNSSPVADRRASSSTEDETFLLNSNVSSRGSGENRRTLAEKLLPKPRKTGVDELRLFYSW
ncbi:hypothetical protein JR316_0008543 [Psilocybe cubensis]|uniref:Uncharacterized protein n=2 Tax=Psilocybe cubensis TaxID=181762 RepID=A0A8H7XI58_PSICU|nr:hypothetical protein JR316_0008543 [Psilocybe cubensis]KAH9479946.1 hypothetical protein JR316_0008543 [Psilocybe cubensis]